MRNVVVNLLVMVFALLAMSADAIDATWSNEGGGEQSWLVASNWSDSAGTVLDAPPTNAADTAIFPDFGTTVRSVQMFGNGSDVSYSLGSVSGGKHWRLVLDGGNNGQFSHLSRAVSIADVNGFKGEWTSAGTWQKLVITTAGDGVQRLESLDPNCQFCINVTSAVARAYVVNLRGTQGAVCKAGPGLLSVAGGLDSKSPQLQIEEGAVEIRGNEAHSETNGFARVYTAAGATIVVPEGHMARVGTLITRGPVIKDGKGTLIVGRVYPSDATIRILDGVVRFETEQVTIPDVDRPAGTPQFWYDADAENTFNVDKDGIVSNWYDRRPEYRTDRQTTRLGFSQVTADPTIDETALPGHRVVDFEKGKAAMVMPSRISGAYAFQREVFMVFSFSSADSGYQHIGAGNSRLNRMGCKFYNPTSADDFVGGGVYTINGVPVYPFEADDGTTFPSGKWFVVSASYTGAVDVKQIASDSNRSHLGNIKIGEIITYDSALSEDERRQTVAYLMKKWLGEDHPDTKPAESVNLSFAESVTAVIGADAQMEIGSVSGGNGLLRKYGTGAVTVSSDLADSFTNLTVSGGTLTIAKPTEPFDNSIYHFDMGDAGTYTDYYVNEQGLTNVHQIADVRSNGVYAASPGRFIVNSSTGHYLYVTNPVVRSGEFAAGVTRPYLDFLDYAYRNVAPPEAVGAGFRIYPSATEAAAAAVREVHCVVSPKKNDASCILNGKNTDFRRGTGGKLLRLEGESAPAAKWVLDGYIAVDGVCTNGTYVLEDDQFHLVSFAPLAESHAESIALQGGNLYAGGLSYAEIIAFGECCTPEERAFWQDKLMYKWFASGVKPPVWMSLLETVAVGVGSTLKVEGGGLRISTITGGGTVDAVKVEGLRTINLTAPVGAALNGLSFNGVVAFADEVMVQLSGCEGLEPGTNVLISASELMNVNLSKWTVAGVPEQYSYRLKENGKTIELVVKPRQGLILFLR